MITKTIGEILDETSDRFPRNDAIVYVNKLRLSYSDFRKKCDRLAKGLMALGVNHGDHIAIWANNVSEWVILQFASAKMGAVLVTVNTYYKARDLEYLLKHADVTTLFLVDGFKNISYINTLNSVVPELSQSTPGNLNSKLLPFLKNIASIGQNKHPGMFSFESIENLGDDISNEEFENRQNSLDVNDVINMQYTSGTTGIPKGVMLSHYNIVNNAFYVGKNLGMTNKDRMCIPVPFFHCFGCVLSTLNCVIHGATMVPIETFDVEKVLHSIEKEKCTVLNGVPAMFIAELRHPNFDSYDLSSLRTGIMGGAHCSKDIMKQVMKKMNMKEITICYGLTESSPVITQTNRFDSIDKRIETVGQTLPYIEAKIVDVDTGSGVPPNTSGELVSRGYNIMKGYYKMQEQTSKSIKNGWIHTKDMAMMDNDGYFKIIGRIDDMIIRGGENIYPKEIEEFLYTNEKIKEVAVVGVPSDKYGEEVCAFVQLKDNVNAEAEEIREFCNEKIARYKIPRYIMFVDSFPMTGSGKIQRFKLRKKAQNLIM